MENSTGLKIRRFRDPRTFSHTKVFGAPSIVGLPNDFIVSEPLKIKNQLDSDMCFPTGTEVLMEDLTYRPIETILVGDFVISHTGTPRRVTKTYRRIWQGNMCHIKIKGDFREIISTPTHPFFTENGIRLAKEITKKDFLLVPKLDSLKRDFYINEFEKDPEFLWLLGLYLAEGSINEGLRVVLSLHKEEKSFFEKTKKIINKYGGNVYFVETKGTNAMNVYISGGNGKWVGIFTDLGNKYCYSKRINKRLMFIDPKLQMNIVDGFCDGDGFVKGNVFSMTCTSFHLMNQLRTILFRNNIFSSFRMNKLQKDRLQSWSLEYIKTDKPYSYHNKNESMFVKVFINEKPFKKYHTGNVYNLEVENDNSYIVNNIAVHNCSAFASSEVSEDQEGVELSPEFIFHKTKLISGDWKSWGASLEDCLKAHSRFGAIEQTETPFTLEDKGRDFIANPKNWTDISLNEKAKKHRKQAYFEVDGSDSIFDSIRATMWQNRAEKRTILAGCYFQPAWVNASQGIVSEVPQGTRIDKGLPHAVKIYGWKTINDVVYLMLQNSWGRGVGDNGIWYIPKGEVDRCFLYAYTFKDYDPNALKEQWNILAKLYDILTDLIRALQKTYGSIFRKT